MLCPEVWNFPSPKILTSFNKSVDNNSLNKIVDMNKYYQSVVVTCPDETEIPRLIEEDLTIDQEYYKITDCSVVTFLDNEFIDNFVKKGAVSCLSIVRTCIVDNCAAVTPEGILKLHIIEHIYQCLGMEGTKRPHNFYEIQIDLKLCNHKKLKNLEKLDLFDFYITWEPHETNICPSSLAKYFYDRNVNISLCNPLVKKLMPSITEIPSLLDVDVSEIVEWIGMLDHDCDLQPEYDYISTYTVPESEKAIKSTRITILHASGFFTPSIIKKLCENLKEYTNSREVDNYWTSISIQTFKHSLWQWDSSRTPTFQTHDLSRSIFFTNQCNSVYSVGQIKFP